MGSQLFGPLDKNTGVKVGYIDPKLGFVDGLSVSDANEHAKKDPGTTFIFKSGDNVLKYLNINEVNSLTEKDLLRTKDDCPGVNNKEKVGPPNISLKGGGGIGAVGNPIIGQDGSILAVDVVRTGHGYAFPPIVTAHDDSHAGNGAVLRAIVGEQVTEVLQYYDRAEDFEEPLPSPQRRIPAGTLWGPNGENLGEWNPGSIIPTDTEDEAIARERRIQEFQNALRISQGGGNGSPSVGGGISGRTGTGGAGAGTGTGGTGAAGSGLGSAGGTGTSVANFAGVAGVGSDIFFSTRKNKPSRITSNNPRINGSVYNVEFPAWGDFMNQHAISPKSPSNVSGSDYAGILFTYEWNLIFPTTGKYEIRGAKDNQGNLYIDNQYVSELDDFNVGIKPIKKFFEAGKHTVRYDIFNSPQYEDDAGRSNTLQNVEIFNTIGYQTKADRKLWRTNTYSADGFLNQYGVCPFNTRKSLPDNPYAGTHVIRWDNIKFPEDGNYVIEVAVDDSAKVSIGNGSADEVVIEKNGFKPNTNKATGVSNYIKFFKAGTYRIRTELTQKEGGRFNFNPDEDGNLKSDVQARFVNDGNAYVLEVTGSGSAEINFNLRTNNTSTGLTSDIKSITIGNARLNRSKNRQKENITGTGSFEAGQKYPIVVKGSSATSGVRLSSDNILEYFGASLSIGRINNITNSSGKGSNPMAFAMRITSTLVGDTSKIAKRSWNQNPMGFAITIDAPPPDTSRFEPPVSEEGRCPPNPIWTTRSPGSQEQWYPVTFPVWSDFTNNYALSPVKPSTEPNSDGGGVVHSNTWKLNIEFPGFYALKATADNGGRILVDGKERIRGGLISSPKSAGKVGVLEGFTSNNPPYTKFYLDEGEHTITVEVENEARGAVTKTKKKVFSTQDWQSDARVSKQPSVKVSYNGGEALRRGLSVSGDRLRVFMKDGDANDTNATLSIVSSDNNARFAQDGKSINYERPGTIKVKLEWDDTPGIAGVAVESIDVGGVKLKQRGVKGSVADSFRVEGETVISGLTRSGSKKGDVIYNGPDLFKFNRSAWSGFMNKNSVSPYLPPLDTHNPVINDTRTYTWSNVDFPESGSYHFELQGDNLAKVFVGDKLIAQWGGFTGEPFKADANISKGKYTIRIESENGSDPPNFVFNTNSNGFALVVSRLVDVRGSSAPWSANPVGVSAVLVSPPCPRKIRGKGLVTDIIVEEPGNGYVGAVDGGSGYPVILQLKEVLVKDPGINYNCGVDKIEIIPDNGAVLDYECNPFGRITKINIVSPGTFNATPIIRIPSDTGVNFEATPIFEVIRDPIGVEERIIQVTDLVGLKQTGYYQGRAYYGAVFFKDGIRYAGYYETPGELVQIYDTLQESIDGEVTTPPSAIQRQGTDVSSNNPRLNFPGTPDNLN